MTPEVMKMLAIGLAAGLGFLGPALGLGGQDRRHQAQDDGGEAEG